MKLNTSPPQKRPGILFWQLAVAFALVVVLAVGGILVAWRLFLGEMPAPPMHHGSPRRTAQCVEHLCEHYAQIESWKGAEPVLESDACSRKMGFRHREDESLLVAQPDGVVAVSSDGRRVGDVLTARELFWATPIELDGETVGWLLVDDLNDRSGLRGFLVLSLFIGLGSMLVGVYLSRQISRPLVTLTQATRAMAAGELDVRVPEQRQRGEVRELAVAFNHMAGQVQETIVTLRRFISDAAHEIHTPLTALRINLELAPEDEFVRHALDQVARLEALTEGLLDLSRIEAAERGASREPLDLVALVRAVSELYASRAEQAGLDFVLDVPDTPLITVGNEWQLQRALGDVIDNAIKFTAEGRVTVRVLRTGDWGTVSIEDTGIGIPEQDLADLFSRFHRGRNTNSYPGNGLGLAIVKAIVEGHGGEVCAENIAHGARFTVRLPMG